MDTHPPPNQPAMRLQAEVSGPVVVKVCLIVLGVMGIVILLDASLEDATHPSAGVLTSYHSHEQSTC